MDLKQLNWFKMALQLRGSVAKIVLPRVAVVGVFGFLISVLYNFGLPVSWRILGSVIANVVFNFVLGLLLVFRTNTAYERFWEGRKAWGVLIVNVRNLSRQIQVGVLASEASDRQSKSAILRLLVAFAVATKLHLRHEQPNEELTALLTPEQGQQILEVKNPPLKVVFWIGSYLKKECDRGHLNISILVPMNTLLDNLVDALTACERILKTPIPLAYAIYLQRLLLIYCVFLPFQLVEDLGWYTGIITAVISFILFGIEEIGREIENPFGYDANDLPLDEICTNMLHNVEDLMLEAESDRPLVNLSADNLSVVELNRE
jgi:ion channel-forming bestrophin family protein